MVDERTDMQKFAIIHTTPVTIPLLNDIAEKLLPGWEIIDFLDDSILRQLASNEGDLRPVLGKLVRFAVLAEKSGAAAVLNACSSVGEAVSSMVQAVSVPVVRIDEAMAEEAVRRGKHIGIAATVETTLNPTRRLIQSKSACAGVEVHLEPILVREAYQKLAVGDRDGHDQVLAAALHGLAERSDVVVLAQASMGRVVAKLPESIRSKFLSSPRSGMERLKKKLEVRDGS
jgi:Asp/Glu/hydantoin racemase